MKTCKECKKSFTIDFFNKKKSNSDGLSKMCKGCISAYNLKIRRTKNGLVSGIYKTQKQSSIDRGHSEPSYSVEELKEWLFAQKLFHKLYDNWKRLDYQIDYIPSVDRKDDYIGYTIDNIQLMTWGENKKKANSDIFLGINKKTSKGVIQLSRDGDFIAEFNSVNHASRITGLDAPSISNCCNKKRYKRVGGYQWRFKDVLV